MWGERRAHDTRGRATRVEGDDPSAASFRRRRRVRGRHAAPARDGVVDEEGGDKLPKASDVGSTFEADNRDGTRVTATTEPRPSLTCADRAPDHVEAMVSKRQASTKGVRGNRITFHLWTACPLGHGIATP